MPIVVVVFCGSTRCSTHPMKLSLSRLATVETSQCLRALLERAAYRSSLVELNKRGYLAINAYLPI